MSIKRASSIAWAAIIGVAGLIGVVIAAYQLGAMQRDNEITYIKNELSDISSDISDVQLSIDREIASLYSLKEEIARVDLILTDFNAKGERQYVASSEKHREYYRLLSEFIGSSVDPDSWVRWQMEDAIQKMRDSYVSFAGQSEKLDASYQAYKDSVGHMMDRLTAELEGFEGDIIKKMPESAHKDGKLVKHQTAIKISPSSDENLVKVETLKEAKAVLAQLMSQFEALDKAISGVTAPALDSQAD